MPHERNDTCLNFPQKLVCLRHLADIQRHERSKRHQFYLQTKDLPFEVGDRVEYDGVRGTLAWGIKPGFLSNFLGISWDDHQRRDLRASDIHKIRHVNEPPHVGQKLRERRSWGWSQATRHCFRLPRFRLHSPMISFKHSRTSGS